MPALSPGSSRHLRYWAQNMPPSLSRHPTAMSKPEWASRIHRERLTWGKSYQAREMKARSAAVSFSLKRMVGNGWICKLPGHDIFCGLKGGTLLGPELATSKAVCVSPTSCFVASVCSLSWVLYWVLRYWTLWTKEEVEAVSFSSFCVC